MEIGAIRMGRSAGDRVQGQEGGARPEAVLPRVGMGMEMGGQACGEEREERETHRFRSNLGRLLSAGEDWRSRDLDVTPDPPMASAGRTFTTSLGQALAGGVHWGELHQRDHSTMTSTMPITPWCPRADHDQDTKVSQGLTALPSLGGRGEGETRKAMNVQEVLWEANRGQGSAVGVRADSGLDEATIKRAELLESQRFLANKAHAEELGMAYALQGEQENEEEEVEVSDAGVQPSLEEAHTPPPSAPSQAAPARMTVLEEGGGHVESSSGRFETALATAMLSVAQRVSDMDARAYARADRLEEMTRRVAQGAEADHLHKEALMARLSSIEAGTEAGARILRRELAVLKDQTRVVQQHQQQRQEAPSPGALAPMEEIALSSSSGESDEARGCFILADNSQPSQAQRTPAGPQLSDPRSSLSEGQVRGAFSDGEMVNLTPSGRDIVEEGELTLPEGGGEGEGTQAQQPSKGSPGPGDGSWASGDPRLRLPTLTSGHPRLEANLCKKAKAKASSSMGALKTQLSGWGGGSPTTAYGEGHREGLGAGLRTELGTGSGLDSESSGGGP
ncbi:unnamed protein product, partial [Discosporangium mesarthrocarpum]